MLTALLVKQFQRHKRLELRFDPGVTVITGATNRGKSAIIRALTWVTRNEPTGEAFIRHGKSEAVVGLRVDDRTILRSRTRSGDSSYKLDGKPFKALRGDVPKEIADVLKLSPLNFQAQHDSPFWFSASPGEVSRRLNEVIDLSIIDTALAKVASKVRHNKAVVDVSKERLEAARAEMKELEFAVELDEDLKRVEAIHESHNTAGEQLHALHELIQEASQAKVLATVELPDFSEVERQDRELDEQFRRIEELRSLIDEARKREQDQQRAQSELAALEQDLHKHTKGRCPLCGGKFHG